MQRALRRREFLGSRIGSDHRNGGELQVTRLQILGRANSFNVRKVLWVCDELGLDYTREDWGRGFRPTTAAEFLRINPIGLVPAVIDDGPSGGPAARPSASRWLPPAHVACGL